MLYSVRWEALLEARNLVFSGVVCAAILVAGGPLSPGRAAAQSAGEERGLEVGLSLDLAAIGGLDTETSSMGVGQSASLTLLVRPHPYVSLVGGAGMFALYGDGAVAWFGTRAGLRLHWGELLGIEQDGWLEIDHIFGLSGPIARHGFDLGIGIGFPLFDALSAGPSIHLIYTDDPDGTPVWALTIGLTLIGWPGRPDIGAPEAYVSPARRTRYVATRNLERARARYRRAGTSPLLPHIELFGMHALDDAHRDDLGFGGGATASVELFIAPWIGIHAGVSGMVVAAPEADPAAWAGTQLGARLHWTALGEIEGDGWIDVHHVYGVSGGIATHGADIGFGYEYDVVSFLRVGPFVRGTLLTDPGNDPALFLWGGVAISMRPPTPGPGNVDGDLWLDREDHCIRTAEGHQSDPDNPGCPLLDRDSDGVPDDDDLCDTEPSGDTPDPDRLGCPLPDRDGDHVPDDHDFCPESAVEYDDGDPLRDGCFHGVQ